MSILIMMTMRLSNKLLKQGYIMERLKSSWKEFMVGSGIFF